MNTESLKHHLATKIMNWTIMQPSGVIVFANNQRSGMKLPDWNPPENTEQAMMCLEKFTDQAILELDQEHVCKWGVNIRVSEHGMTNHHHDLLSMAISLACAKATGWEDSE